MKISKDIEIDLATLRGQRAIFQGASGSGKSNGARLLLEATYGQFQHIIIDVEDEFHTLRAGDREYAIIGGDHGDAPLAKKQDHGALALTLLQIGVSTVIQIGDWTLEEKRSFVGNFVAGLMRAKSDLWHPTIVMLDEAHLFVPQQGVVSSSEAVTHLATAGRKRGFSAIFATQRLSLINKDVLGQCENKFLGRVEQAADRRAVADQLGFSPSSTEAVAMQAFRPGEFYVVGPAVSRTPVCALLFKAATEAPKPGTTVLPSATPSAIRKALAALAAASRQESAPATASAHATSGPRGANAQEIAAAEQRGYDRGYERGREEGFREGRSVGSRSAAHNQMLRVVEAIGRAAMINGDSYALEAAYARMKEVKIERDAGSPSGKGPDFGSGIAGSSPAPATTPAASPQPSGQPLPSSQKIVDAIVAAHPISLSLTAAAKRAGLSPRSSAFRRYLKEAAESPLIRQQPDGRYVAIAADSSIAAAPGLAAFKQKLPPAYARMLEVLELAAGAILSKEMVADRAGVSRTSSGLLAGLKELVAQQLVEKVDGGYRISLDFVEG